MQLLRQCYFPNEIMNAILQKIEKPLIGLVVAIAIVRWLQVFMIWPDSSNYLTAAMNFVNHGTLLVSHNWPSRTLQLVPEYFSTYPPGYPFYLVPFLIVFRDPMLAAALAHSLALVLFFGTLHRLFVALEFPPALRIIAFLFFLVFPAFTLIWVSLLTEPLYVALCLGLFLCALRLPENNSRWRLAALLLFWAASLRWYGFSAGSVLLLPLYGEWKKDRPRAIRLSVLLALAATGPNLLWFIRNTLQIKSTTGFYHFVRILWENAAFPFQHSIARWGFGHWWLALGWIFFALAPLYLKLMKQKMEKIYFFQLLGAAAVQFLAIYFLSLVVQVTPVDDRYLFPSYCFFMILFFYSASLIWRAFPRLQGAIALIALLSAFTLLRPGYLIVRDWHAGLVSLPEERALWRELKEKPYYRKATHFYSNENWVHQIFAGLPQKIVWPNVVATESASIPAYWAIGTNPFFVVNKNSDLHFLFQKEYEGKMAGLQWEEIGNFVAYYRGP